MIGAALMVRPDTMAELLGIPGLSGPWPGFAVASAGVVILGAAILTKQNRGHPS